MFWGCYHNGTWYGDQSAVPTMEKCLNCQCNKKSLVCRLKVCPEMPMPPPRGCVVVQKKNICCPYLSCARLEAFYKIPMTRRIIAYLDHYERESIDRVVNDNMLQRRSDDSENDLQGKANWIENFLNWLCWFGWLQCVWRMELFTSRDRRCPRPICAPIVTA